MKNLYEFKTDGISCAGCVKAITKAIKTLDPNAEVEINIKDKIIKINSQQEKQILAAAIEEEGYSILKDH